MARGLCYPTGREMPPGMQELAAVKLSRQLQEAATVAEAVAQEMERQKEIDTPQAGIGDSCQLPCEGSQGRMEVGEIAMTNGDRIRSMGNEELAAKLFWAYQCRLNMIAATLTPCGAT